MASTPDPVLDIPRITAALHRHGVEYLLVGGVAATIHGATRRTLDVDCLARHDIDNLSRLAAAMRELNARLHVEGLDDAEAAALPVVIDGESLWRMEISTWRTDAGDLDILNDIPDRRGRRLLYEDLVQRSEAQSIVGVAVRVAALEDVIASKEWANRPKDHLALPELRVLRLKQITPGPGRQRRPDLGPDLGL